jgi:Kef-type K+ transport system membrane component KefB
MKSMRDLGDSLSGMKMDILLPLLVTSVVIPVFKSLGLSPILGFLAMGTLLGPSCLNAVSDVHALDHMGEVGIVFFLFEMGLELSVGKLISMKRDVFGLGLSQFVVSAAVLAKGGAMCGLGPAAACTVGGSLALSSSAFVLQLLKDKNALGTRYVAFLTMAPTTRPTTCRPLFTTP